jgi:hypothetical protein
MEPNFAVSAITTEEELADAGRRTVIEYLQSVSLDELRKAVHRGFGASSNGDNHVQGEVRLDEETPQNLLFIISYADGVAGMVVTITPEQFDRSDEEQEALYQKCLGILRIHAEAPIVARRDTDSTCVGPFRYICFPPQEHVDEWKAVLERWTATGS